MLELKSNARIQAAMKRHSYNRTMLELKFFKVVRYKPYKMHL